LKALLHKKIGEIDWAAAKADIAPFIPHKERLEIWSEKFFQELLEELRVVDSPTLK
jgi:hypothetical protein